MKFNGLQIFAVYSCVMFIMVAILTAIFKADVSAQSTTETEKPPVQTTAAPEPAADPHAPVPDPPEADDTWAMFLVNKQNPVSKDYCSNIDTEWVYESWKPYYMDARCAPHLIQMIEDAEKDGIHLVIVSGYRTFEYQQDNFDRSVEERINERGMSEEEAIADTKLEVAQPGESEHNSGLACDIMQDDYTDMTDDGFKYKEGYAWLSEHAADYGFILSFPEGKTDITGIKFEPWHYRYVGKYYAKIITEKKLCLEEFFDEMNWTDKDGKAVYHITPGNEKTDDDADKGTDTDTDDDTSADESTDEYGDDPETGDNGDTADDTEE